jgi:hypothetical protein
LPDQIDRNRADQARSASSSRERVAERRPGAAELRFSWSRNRLIC